MLRKNYLVGILLCANDLPTRELYESLTKKEACELALIGCEAAIDSYENLLTDEIADDNEYAKRGSIAEYAINDEDLQFICTCNADLLHRRSNLIIKNCEKSTSNMCQKEVKEEKTDKVQDVKEITKECTIIEEVPPIQEEIKVKTEDIQNTEVLEPTNTAERKTVQLPYLPDEDVEMVREYMRKNPSVVDEIRSRAGVMSTLEEKWREYRLDKIEACEHMLLINGDNKTKKKENQEAQSLINLCKFELERGYESRNMPIPPSITNPFKIEPFVEENQGMVRAKKGSKRQK